MVVVVKEEEKYVEYQTDRRCPNWLYFTVVIIIVIRALLSAETRESEKLFFRVDYVYIYYTMHKLCIPTYIGTYIYFSYV